jgi:hypothetical protein
VPPLRFLRIAQQLIPKNARSLVCLLSLLHA